jgi:hypothetical protein
MEYLYSHNATTATVPATSANQVRSLPARSLHLAGPPHGVQIGGEQRSRVLACMRA